MRALDDAREGGGRGPPQRARPRPGHRPHVRDEASSTACARGRARHLLPLLLRRPARPRRPTTTPSGTSSRGRPGASCSRRATPRSTSATAPRWSSPARSSSPAPSSSRSRARAASRATPTATPPRTSRSTTSTGVQTMFRGTLRNLGHCETWKAMGDDGPLRRRRADLRRRHLPRRDGPPRRRRRVRRDVEAAVAAKAGVARDSAPIRSSPGSGCSPTPPCPSAPSRPSTRSSRAWSRSSSTSPASAT
jgi:hypothetical protein